MLSGISTNLVKQVHKATSKPDDANSSGGVAVAASQSVKSASSGANINTATLARNAIHVVQSAPVDGQEYRAAIAGQLPQADITHFALSIADQLSDGQVETLSQDSDGKQFLTGVLNDATSITPANAVRPELQRIETLLQALVEPGPADQPDPNDLQDSIQEIFAEALEKLQESRDPGEPFTQRTRDEINATFDAVDKSGDLSQLDKVDNFRQTLPPELQAEYDLQLAELRNDPRIDFSYPDGDAPSAALEDMALRGILAATFGNPKSLDQTLDILGGGNGSFPIIIHQGPVPIGDYYPGAEGEAAGLALIDGGIAIDANFFRDAVAQGDNPFVHEFAHLAQRLQTDGSDPVNGQQLPGDFPFSESVIEHYESDEFQQFIVDRFFGGVTPLDDEGNPKIANGGAEMYPTLLNLFRQFPEQLQGESPEIYQSFVEYFGYDPLTGSSSPPVQLNGTGSVETSVDVLINNYDVLPTGSDGKLSLDELQEILDSDAPSIPVEVRAAAAFLLSSPVSRYALDVGAGKGDVDGNISLEDLVGVQDQLASGVTLFEIVADTASGRGGRDNNISKDDLLAVLTDPGIPTEVKLEAVRELLFG